MPSSESRPCAVLDTNVVLDWLVFKDPSCQALGAAIESGALQWLASAELRAEFDAVLARGVGLDRKPDPVALDISWRRLAEMRAPAPAAGETGWRSPCRCTDPDDQKFIDLALHSGARWLFSRDRAVLKLAREARIRGLAIIEPTAWRPDNAAAPAPT